MFIMPSFKKSLIVEQFQGNYLKYRFIELDLVTEGCMALTHALHGVQNVSAHCLTKVDTVLKSRVKIAFLSLNVA